MGSLPACSPSSSRCHFHTGDELHALSLVKTPAALGPFSVPCPDPHGPVWSGPCRVPVLSLGPPGGPYLCCQIPFSCSTPTLGIELLQVLLPPFSVPPSPSPPPSSIYLLLTLQLPRGCLWTPSQCAGFKSLLGHVVVRASYLISISFICKMGIITGLHQRVV